MRFGGQNTLGKISTRMAQIAVAPYKHRYPLAKLYPHGFTSPDAILCQTGLIRGNHVYIGSRVVLYRQISGGKIILGNKVHLNDGIRVETGLGGTVEIGEATFVQPACQFSAYVGSIKVGKNVQIAPRCAFYPYNHGTSRDRSMSEQPAKSKGDIVIKDEAWLGYGTIILDNVSIGFGAVIGAGSVVTNDIPDYAIAAGIPAKIIKMRN
jgi:acetyltransferase-like isoleucine patch superfamily enzyme